MAPYGAVELMVLIIGVSGNGVPPVRCEAITWTKTDPFPHPPARFCFPLTVIHMHEDEFKISVYNIPPICPSLNVLTEKLHE